MRAPTIKIRNFRIRYRQIPYVERFFFVDIRRKDYGCPSKLVWDKNFMKIVAFHEKFQTHECPLRWVFGFVVLLSEQNRLNKFMDKVKEYDNYLDEE